MMIAERLRELREQKKMSQGDIEKKTGLLRCYISRVENGHTVPAIETLEKLAHALEVPLYRLFHEGANPEALAKLPKERISNEVAFGSKGKQAVYLRKLRGYLSKASNEDRKLILLLAQKVAHGRGRQVTVKA